MNHEKDLLKLSRSSTDRKAAILIAEEVICAELKRLLSEPIHPPANPPAKDEKDE